MPPLIYLVRHGEAQNNVGIRDEAHKIQDAVLTDHGKEQCQELRRNFQYHDLISLVVSSPLRRALQTACIAFGPTVARRSLPFIVTPLAQEVNDLPCDMGHSKQEIQQQLPTLIDGQNVGLDPSDMDFSLLEDGWNSKQGAYAPDAPTIQKRAAALRAWLFQRPEPHVLLVTHGAFLHYLTEDWAGDDPERGTAYLNCEVRRFSFSPQSTEEEAHLVKVDK